MGRKKIQIVRINDERNRQVWNVFHHVLVHFLPVMPGLAAFASIVLQMKGTQPSVHAAKEYSILFPGLL